MEPYIGCTVKTLPTHLTLPAAATAIAQNPANRASPGRVLALFTTLFGTGNEIQPTAEHLAVMTKRYWGAKGVKLTVGFMDGEPADLQARILSHMNAWSKYGNVSFVATKTSPQVRIARAADGYWSYLGTDILSIPQNEQTMNLEGFTMNTPESEFHRVVRHETGHTLGFPHEHMRAEIIARIDRAKAIAYFEQTQGWSQSMVIDQVLTPISAAEIQGTAHADQDSIMCYDMPASITNDGQPIRGGVDIDAQDQAFVGKIYPLAVVPPVNPPPVKPPVAGAFTATISIDPTTHKIVQVS